MDQWLTLLLTLMLLVYLGYYTGDKRRYLLSVTALRLFYLLVLALKRNWLFDGYKVAGFTDEEEDQTPYGKLGISWYLENELKNYGAVFDDGDAAWVSYVVVDRNVVTRPESRLFRGDCRSYFEKTGGRSQMNNQDVARMFFARMDSHDSSGALALVAPKAEVTLVPLKLQGDVEWLGASISNNC